MDVLSLIRTELSHAGTDQDRLDRMSRLEQRRITPDKVLPQMEFLFRLFGKPCFPRGELIGLTGKPKSGKTFVSSVIMTLCFRQEVLSIHREPPDPLRVLWYDTEQSDESTQDILVHRILPMAFGERESPDDGLADENIATFNEFPEDSFHVFNVRAEPWRERLPLLEVAIEEYRPDLVILDGIRDLINDINDGVLAQDVVERLMHLASNQHCCIVCILHQNKSAEDKNLRGWIGTELTHKAFEVYECEKDSDRVFSFSQQLTRKYDILDTLKYVVDENGIPQIASVESVIEDEKRQHTPANSSRPELNQAYILDWDGSKPIFDIPSIFADALPQEGTLYFAKDMQERVMKLTNMVSIFLYNSIREKALNAGIIVKTTDEFDHINYYRPRSETPEAAAVKPEPIQRDLFENIPFAETGPPGDVPF